MPLITPGNGGTAPRPDHDCRRPNDFLLIDRRFEAVESSRDLDRALLDSISDRLGHRADHLAGTHATGMTAALMGLADAVAAQHEQTDKRFDALSLQILGAAKAPQADSLPPDVSEITRIDVMSPVAALARLRKEKRKSAIYGVAMVVFALAALVASVAKLLGR